MEKPRFRKNPKTGRLEKLINGKYVPQREMGFWKDGLKVIKGTKRNVDAVGRKDGETRVKNGRKQRWNGKDGRWINVSNQQTTKKKTTSGLSETAQKNLQTQANIKRAKRKKYAGMTQKEINALKAKEGEGIANKRTMSTFREDSEENKRLQQQAKTGSKETYKRVSSSGETKSDNGNKKNDGPKQASKESPFLRAGRTQSKARNSVARMKYELKKRR